MQLFKNNAFSALAGALSSGATSLTVTTATGDRFPIVAGSDYFYLTLQDASNNIEVVKVTARAAASDSMTITRAQDGTTARSWSIGDIAEQRLNAAAIIALTILEGAGSAAGLLTKLGLTAYGQSLVAAIDAAAARVVLGATSVGSSLFTAIDQAAAREAIGALDAADNIATATLAAAATNAAATAAAKDATLTAASTAFVDRLRSLLPSTTSGTLVLSDRGSMVPITAAMTIPANVFAANDVVTIYNNTAGSLTITQGAGLTLRQPGTANTGNRTLMQRGLCTVTFISATEAAITGAGVA